MKKKKSILTVVGCIALATLLAVSTYISIVVVGVFADEGKKGNIGIINKENEDVTTENTTQTDYMNNYIINTPQNSDNTHINGYTTPPQTTQNNNSIQIPQATQGIQPQPFNTLLDTNKSAWDIVKIYADLMNNAKAQAPGFTKLEYQVFPDDPANRVVTEGEESIDKVFGFVNSLGLIVTKEEAEKEPYIHQKGDGDMSGFPVFNMPKGSYLTDPNGIVSYSYQLLSNGNVKMTFVLVSEMNPEPVSVGSDVAPSYTGAVFSPMSKAKIDNTVNHPIVGAFAKDIKYSLRYHDCKVEVEFNPNNLQIVNLLHLANVTLKGSGDVVLGGKMSLEKQELISTMVIKDIVY